MTTPRENRNRRATSSAGGDAYDVVREPVAPRIMPSHVDKYLRMAEEKRPGAAEEPPPLPRWPMLSGNLTFPFYLNTLAAWIYISFGLMVAGWLLMAWLGPALILGGLSARLFGLPTCLMASLTFGYASSCCLTIIEQTSQGWNSIEVSPGLDWKEWIWNFTRLIVAGLQAGVVGLAVSVLSNSDSWLPGVAGTFAAFPLILLASLAADAWVPLAIRPVLHSLVDLWWAWGLFYLQTAALAAGWFWLTKAGLEESLGVLPGAVPLFSAPLLALIILIYARLAGRLAGCIAEASTTDLTEGDDDEDL
jgi:hypothetical protein